MSDDVFNIGPPIELAPRVLSAMERERSDEARKYIAALLREGGQWDVAHHAIEVFADCLEENGQPDIAKTLRDKRDAFDNGSMIGRDLAIDWLLEFFECPIVQCAPRWVFGQ